MILRLAHKVVFSLIIASAIAMFWIDAQNVRHRRGIFRQVGKVLSRRLKYTMTSLRYLRSKRVLAKDATIYDANPLFMKYRKYGGKERAENDFTLLGPYDFSITNYRENIAIINGNVMKEGDIGGYTVLLKYFKTDDGHKYSIQMFKTAQDEGIKRAPMIQVDYI